MWPYPHTSVYDLSVENLTSDMAILDAVINILDEDVDGNMIHGMAIEDVVDELKGTRNAIYRAYHLKKGWCPMCLQMPVYTGDKLCYDCKQKYAGKDE